MLYSSVIVIAFLIIEQIYQPVVLPTVLGSGFKTYPAATSTEQPEEQRSSQAIPLLTRC